MKITDAIYAKMDELGVNNAELARRCGVSPQTMCGRLKERRGMTLDVAMITLDGLDCALAVVPKSAKLPKYAILLDEHSEPYKQREGK